MFACISVRKTWAIVLEAPKTFFYKINQVVGSHQTLSNTMQNVCYVHIFNHATYYMKFETHRVYAQVSFPPKCCEPTNKR